MDFSLSELNLNSVETLPGFEARAAFTVNLATIFREYVDIVPTIVDENLSYIPWGGDNLMPFKIIEHIEMSEDDFDHILEYSDMCDKHGQEAVDDYMEFHDELDNFEEAYCGEWDSEEDFARYIVEECYDLERSMGDLARYFDYEAFGRELFMYDYSMGANNHVFRVI